MVECKCDYCGKIVYKKPSLLKQQKHVFCSRECMNNAFNKDKNPDKYKEMRDLKNCSIHMSNLNQKLNPTRMTSEVKEKISINKRINKDDRKTYPKVYGKHLHRIIAENILGRPLKKGEIVHHIDGNKNNNSPENIIIFANQSEHAKWHATHDKNWGKKKGGD